MERILRNFVQGRPMPLTFESTAQSPLPESRLNASLRHQRQARGSKRLYFRESKKERERAGSASDDCTWPLKVRKRCWKEPEKEKEKEKGVSSRR